MTLPCLAVAAGKTLFTDLESEHPEIRVRSFMEIDNLTHLL